MHGKKTVTIIVVIFAVLVGFPGWMVYREVRHTRLNRMLIVAIEAERYKEALSLLKQGADGTARRSDGTDTSFAGAARRLIDKLRHRRTVPTDQVYDDCALAILYAPNGYDTRRTEPEYQKQHPDTQRLALALLKAGSPTDFEAVESMPNLVLIFHHHEVLKKLLEMHPDVVTKCSLEHADMADTSLLLAHGADANDTYDDQTPAFSADAAKLRLLIKYGAKVNVADGFHNTPLLWACDRGDDDAVRVLIEHGANVRARDDDGFTPSLRASGHCRLETVKRLVSQGADVHDRAKSGDTTLILSMYNADQRVFRWLLSQGIDVNLRGKDGKTALMAAAELGLDAAFKTLLASGADPNHKGVRTGRDTRRSAAATSIVITHL
jgi:ankyrin repeat protein